MALDSTLRLIVDKMWHAVIGDKPIYNKSKDIDPENAAFFETWEEAIFAAQFVAYYKTEGISVAVEEVIEAPTRWLQWSLVEKRKVSTS